MFLSPSDLAPLKAQLDRIEQKLEILLRQSGATLQDAPEEAWLLEVRRLVRGGKKIEAIKLHREHTGLGLRESKDAVEAME